jgi:phage terminase small subunit
VSTPVVAEAPSNGRVRPAKGAAAEGQAVKSPLSDLGERFAAEYVIDLNAAAAYRRIRPKVKATTARVEACKLLTNPNVQTRVAELKAAQMERLQITADRLLQELAITAFSDVLDYQVGGSGRLELAPGAHPLASRALASVKHKTRTMSKGDVEIITHEVEYRLWPKVDALKALGEHLKLFRKDNELAGCEIILGPGEEVRLVVRGKQ